MCFDNAICSLDVVSLERELGAIVLRLATMIRTWIADSKPVLEHIDLP